MSNHGSTCYDLSGRKQVAAGTGQVVPAASPQKDAQEFQDVTRVNKHPAGSTGPGVRSHPPSRHLSGNEDAESTQGQWPRNGRAGSPAGASRDCPGPPIQGSDAERKAAPRSAGSPWRGGWRSRACDQLPTLLGLAIGGGVLLGTESLGREPQLPSASVSPHHAALFEIIDAFNLAFYRGP